MKSWISRSGFWASRRRSWATMTFATCESIGVPRKMIRSFSRRE
jgi:hypothetical protein